MDPEKTIYAKEDRLREILSGLGSVLIAFSGGVDSSFLLKEAKDVLGENVLAVTAVSPVRKKAETERARSLALDLGVEHIILESSELLVDEVRGNSRDRCYHCKKNIFKVLLSMRDERGIGYVCDGSHAGDEAGYRPGKRAIEELGVRSPLYEAGMLKDDIRELSRIAGLITWDMPSQSCLLTRFPYGRDISSGELVRVGEAEKYLDSLGLRDVRVRSYGNSARIEINTNDMEQAASPGLRGEIVRHLKELGYRYVSLDLEGFRSGSMDD